MILNKKGADLSVNVIIVAIIALLVLVVLFAIFTGRMSWFNKGVGKTVNSCPPGTKASLTAGPNCVPTVPDAEGKVHYCCPTK